MMLDRTLVHTARRYPSSAGAAVGLQLVLCTSYVAQAVVLAAALAALVAGDTTRLAFALVGIAALVALRLLLTWAQARAAARLGAQVRVHLRDEALAGALVPAALHDPARRDGALRATLVDGVDGVDAYVTRYLPAVAQVVVMVPLITLLLLTFHPLAGLLAGLAAGAAVLVPMAWRRVLARRSSEHWDTYEGLGSDLLESLRGMTTLRLLGRVPQARERLAERSDALHRATVRTMRVSLIDTALIDACVQGGSLAAVGLAVHHAADPSGAAPAFGSYLVLLLTSEVFRPIRDLSRAWHAGYLGTSAVGALVALGIGAQTTDRPGSWGVASAVGPDRSALAADVVVDDLSFTYPGSDVPVLAGASARFAVGEVCAVVGPSGAGKSTLLDVLLGHLQPARGTVRRGEAPLDPDDIAVITQRPVLFEGTVRDNLRVGRPEASDADLLAACDAAGIRAELDAMPGGLDARIATAGATVSGGQRQRFAVARAIVANRPVVLADEPTSALDPVSALAVTAALRDLARDRVVIVVAHREESIQGADRVVELRAGRLVSGRGEPVEPQQVGR